MTTKAYAVANGFLGLGLEAVRGVAAASPLFIPTKEPKNSPMVTWLKDEGLRGSPVTIYDQVPGVRHDEFEVKGDVQLDTFALYLIGVLGAADAISGGGPYAHLQGLLNDYTVGSQPPSFTVSDFNGAMLIEATAAQLESLELTFAIDAALTYAAKFISNIATAGGGPPAATFGVEPILPNWVIAATINAVDVHTVEEFSCKIDRAVESIHTGGNQGPYSNFAGPCAVSGKGTFVLNDLDDPFAIGGSEWSLDAPAALARVQLPISLLWTDPITSHSLAVQMSNVQFSNPVIERGKKYVEVTVDYEANANTTDATDGGYSPIQTTVTNAVAAAYVGS
jgi:hypothetical protein